MKTPSNQDRKPGISIVVPVYNREDLVVRCLESVKKQSVKPYELIVVDNGSTDSTLERVKCWQKDNAGSCFKINVLSEKTRGACHARQRGLEEASGDFVIFFDSDDEMTPTLIENVSDALERQPGADIVCWKSRIHMLDGSERIPAFMADNPLEAHLIHTLLRPQGYAVRKELLLEAGGWSKPVKVWNDLELGLRLLLKDPKIVAVDKVLAEIYAQEESITGKDFSSKQGEWETTIREMGKVNSVSHHLQKEKIDKILVYRMVNLAAQYRREGNMEAARHLMNESLRGVSFKDKMILKFAYNYTSRCLRGAWRLIRSFY